MAATGRGGMAAERQGKCEGDADCDLGMCSGGDGTIDLAANRMLETRLMVREPSGQWGAVTYVWDADQKDATLVRSGRNIAVDLVDAQGTRTSFTYAVPTDAQCLACHVTNVSTGAFEAIGPQASNLNRDYAFTARTLNQPLPIVCGRCPQCPPRSCRPGK